MKETRKPRRLRREGDQAGYPPLPRAGAEGREWRRHAWRMLALWALVLAAYSNSFESGLVFGNATHPAGYHWVNLALHGVNVSLVYLLGILVLGAPAPALALAALWGLHPLLTESVTNIVGRADLLAGFGVLAGLLCYAKSATALGRRKLFWLAAMVAAQTAGIFSKENAAVLPGIMLLYDLTWSPRAAWRERAPAYAALMLPLAAFFYLRVALQVHILAPFADNPDRKSVV